MFPTTLQLVTKVLEKSPIFGHVLNGYKYHNWGLGYTFIDDLKNVVIVRLTRRYRAVGLAKCVLGSRLKTHYPGERFSVRLCLGARRGSVFFVASNAKLISETRAVYRY